MGCACTLHAAYAWCMTTIQVRNVPEETSRALKAKAALEGKSLSNYLLDELERLPPSPVAPSCWPASPSGAG